MPRLKIENKNRRREITTGIIHTLSLSESYSQVLCPSIKANKSALDASGLPAPIKLKAPIYFYSK